MNVDDGYFGERVAAGYDESYADMFEPAVVDEVTSLLAGLARGGRALELGIGTGRIALPLASSGVPVHGIDSSPAMVARLRAKPGGDAIGVTVGDFATARAGGTFSVAYLIFNTIMKVVVQGHQPQYGWGAVLRVPRGAEQVALEDGDAVPGGDLVQPLTDSGLEIAVHDVGQGVPAACSLPLRPDEVKVGDCCGGQRGPELTVYRRGQEILGLVSAAGSEGGGDVVCSGCGDPQGAVELRACLIQPASYRSDGHFACRRYLLVGGGRGEVPQQDGHLQWLGQLMQRGPDPVA